MRIIYLILIALTLVQLSCSNLQTNKTIRPQIKIEGKQYHENDFERKLFSYSDGLRYDLSRTHKKIGVKRTNDGVIFGKAHYDNYFFDVEDGKLEIINNGEFGGELNFIPKDDRLEKVQICPMPVNFVFHFDHDIYFAVGLPLLPDSKGVIFRLIREGNTFSYEEAVRLNSAPMGIAVMDDKILVAGYSRLIIIEDFKARDFPCCYGANSIAAKSESDIFIGLKNGYAKVSLKTKVVEEFALKEGLE